MPEMEDEIRARTLKLVSDYQTLVGQRRFDEWFELWAEDGIFEMPFAPHGRRRTYRGKEAIRANIMKSMGRVTVEAVDYFRVLPMLNPENAVVEAAIRGRVVKTGQAYNQSYVFFFETNEGKIVKYREYWNALVSMDAFGGRDTWTTEFEATEAI